LLALFCRLVFLRGKYNYAEWATVLIFAFGLARVVGTSKWWRWLQVALCVGFVYLFITYVADPVALLLSGMSWEGVQYSF
jgi:hypothetical protein